jgi:signal transduction histidine kinase
MDGEDAPPVDLLEEIRAVLDRVDDLLRGRVVDIEMARVRVVVDPAQFQQTFAGLIAAAVARTDAANAITVRVARSGKTARIEVINEGSPLNDDVLSMSVTLAAGTSHAADG